MKADKAQVQRLLKTARGQLDGILNMVEEDRYCIDISNQILAAQSILSCCVREAAESGNAEEKIEEISALLQKLLK